MFVAGLAAAAISLTSTAICAVLRKKSRPTKKIHDQIAELENRIKGIEDEIEYFQAWPHEPGVEKFGVRSIEALREKQRDRHSFILQFARETGLPASPQKRGIKESN